MKFNFFGKKEKTIEESFSGSDSLKRIKKNNEVRSKNAITIFAEQDVSTQIKKILEKYDIHVAERDYSYIKEAEGCFDKAEIVLVSDTVITTEKELLEEFEHVISEHAGLRIAMFFSKDEFCVDDGIRKRLRAKLRDIGIYDVFFPDVSGNIDFKMIGETLRNPSALEIEIEREKMAKEAGSLKAEKEDLLKKIEKLQNEYQDKESKVEAEIKEKISEVISQEQEKRKIAEEEIKKEYENKIADLKSELIYKEEEAKKLLSEKEEEIRIQEDLKKEIQKLTVNKEEELRGIYENSSVIISSEDDFESISLSINSLQDKIKQNKDNEEEFQNLSALLSEKEIELANKKAEIDKMLKEKEDAEERFLKASFEIGELTKKLKLSEEKTTLDEEKTYQNKEQTKLLTEKIERLESEYNDKIISLKERLERSEEEKAEEIKRIKNEALEEIQIRDEKIENLKERLSSASISGSSLGNSKHIGVFNVSQGAGATITSVIIYYLLTEKNGKNAAIIGSDLESLKEYMDNKDIYEYKNESDITRLISLAKRNGKEYIIIDFGTIINLDSAGDTRVDERLSEKQGLLDELERLDVKIGLAHTGDTQINKLKFWNNIADTSYIFYVPEYNEEMGFLSESDIEKIIKELDIDIRNKKNLIKDLANLLFNIQVEAINKKDKKSLPKFWGM